MASSQVNIGTGCTRSVNIQQQTMLEVLNGCAKQVVISAPSLGTLITLVSEALLTVHVNKGTGNICEDNERVRPENLREFLCNRQR